MKPYIGTDCVNLIKTYLDEHSLTKHFRKRSNFQIIWSKPFKCAFTKQIRVNCINGVADICFDQWHSTMENITEVQFLFYIFNSTQTEWSQLDDDFFTFFGEVPLVPHRPTDMGTHGYVLIA